MGIRSIMITFPEEVEVGDGQFQRLGDIASEICDAYTAMHPGRLMWTAGFGYAITRVPMTAEEEKEYGIQFADDALHIECAERADYDWPCAKCAYTQGDHKGCIVDPPAGACDFRPKISEAKN